MGKIWFGNAEKMMWVNCPSTNIQRGRGKWEASGGFLNGGAYVKSSPMSHRKYSIDWNLMESYEAAKIMSYYEGVYGQSPIQFVDPFAAKSNILPLHWSTPRLCAEGGAPSLAGVAETADGAFSALESAPSKGAFFPSTPAGGPRAVIPVPPGKNLYIGAQGGTSTVLRTNQARNPAPSTAYTMAPFEVNSNLIPNPSFETNATVSSSGVGVTLARLTTRRPERIGNSLLGVSFDNTAANQGYVGQFVSVTPSDAGRWFGFSALVGRSVGDAQQSRVITAFYNGATFISQVNSPNTLLRNSNLDRVAAVGQIPAGTTQVRCYVWFFGANSSTGVTTGTCLSDGWIATVKSAEAEAAYSVSDSGYFDGSGAGAGVQGGMTASWTGTAHASSSTLTAVPPQYWFTPPGGAFQYMNGNNVLEVRSRNNGGMAYCDPRLATQPTAGQWVAMGVDFKPHNTLSRDTSRLQIAAYNGAFMSGTSAQAFSSAVGQWTRAVHARQVLDAGTGPQVIRTLVWPSGSTGDGQAFAVRNYVVAYANTEAEARAMVATRLDGDMPGGNYSWSGVAGDSASIETAGAIRSVPAGSGLKVKDSSGVVHSVPYNNGRATSLTLVDPGTCEVYYTGGFLSGAIATIGTEEPNQNVFRPGEGNTGLRFVGEPTRTGYSSVLDLESVSAEFVETGVWE